MSQDERTDAQVVERIAALLVDDAELRTRVAEMLVGLSFDLESALVRNTGAEVDAKAHTAPVKGEEFGKPVKITQIDTQARRMTVSVPKGYPVQQGKDTDTRLYAYTPVGRVTVAKKLVNKGVTTERIERRAAYTNEMIEQKVAAGQTYMHTPATQAHVPAPPAETQADTPAPETEKAKPVEKKKATKASARTAKKAARKAQLIADHKKGDGSCYCTTGGHECKALRLGWTS